MTRTVLAIAGLAGIFLQTSFAQEDFWNQTNGPYFSLIRNVSVAPGGTIFAGDNYGGLIYRSTDHGVTWENFEILGREMGIGMVLSTDSGHVLAVGSDSLFLSSDDGLTWSVSDSGVPHAQTFLALLQTPDGKLYGGRARDYYNRPTLFRSVDGGKSWTALSGGLPPASFTSLLYADGNLFAGSIDYEGGGLYRSSDAGDTWIELDTLFRHRSLDALTADSSGDLLAGSREWILRSEDSGSRWIFADSLEASPYSIWGSNITSLCTSPGGVVSAGTYDGLYWSNNRGLNWSRGALAGIQVTSLASDPENGLLFIGTQLKGVFRSADGGQQWTQVQSGITRTGVYGLEVCGNRLLAGTYLAGLCSSLDHGDHWELVASAQGTASSFAKAPAGQLVAASGGSIMASSDCGGTWADLPASHFSPSSVAADSAGRLYAAVWQGVSNGLYRSTDDGATWELTSFRDTGVTAIAVGPNGFLYTCVQDPAYDDGIMMRSTDSGSTWKKITDGIAWVYPMIRSIVFTGDGTIVIGGYPWGDYPSLYRSSDNGDHWTSAGGSGMPSPEPSIYDLMPAQNNVLYAATHRGVFSSTNHGDTWVPLLTGLHDTAVYALALDSSGYLYAGTDMGGLHRSRQPVTGVFEPGGLAAPRFSLGQNYPNPFNPVTHFEFQIADPEFVTLNVYDVLGREVATLVNEMERPGSYRVTWDARSFPTGVYFARLQAGRFAETKKFVLIR